MTPLRLILNLPESLIPGGMVFLETENMFKEIRFQSVFPLFVFSYDPRSLLAPRAWVIWHLNGSLFPSPEPRKGIDVEGVKGRLKPRTAPCPYALPSMREVG